MAVENVINKDHLTIEGIKKILALKASINWGLSDSLKESFPDIIPLPRPITVMNLEI